MIGTAFYLSVGIFFQNRFTLIRFMDVETNYAFFLLCHK
jgi:hypothetical protein